MIDLPKLHHRHDRAWIIDQLNELADLVNHHAANFASVKYSGVYEQVINDESIDEIRRECEARRESNTRLRKYVEAMRNKYRKLTN